MSGVRAGGRVLVSGASGFVGGHAVRLLADAGYEVVPLRTSDYDLTLGWPSLEGVDGILHLAGLAAVGPSFDDPQRYLDVNSSMVTRLGEQLLAAGGSPRVVVVSSGAVYRSSSQPLDEEAPLDFTSPYVVSKVLVENQVRYYRNRGLDVVVARPFNHIGPGQGPGFLVPDLAARLRALEPGATLATGNLASRRDYTDVRDVVAAYRALLELPAPQNAVYNVASGVSRSGLEVLEALCAALGIPVPAMEQTDRRNLDPDEIAASAGRLRRETGWTPVIPFEESIRDFLAAN